MTATTLDLRCRTHDLLASLARGVRDYVQGEKGRNPFALHGRGGCPCRRPACLRSSLFRACDADDAERGGRDVSQPLCTSNVKHFRAIPLLELERLVS